VPISLVSPPSHPPSPCDEVSTLPKVDTKCTTPSLIPTVNGNTVRSFSTHGQQSAAKGSSTAVSQSDIRLIQHFDSSAHGLVRRWLLIGYFLILYYPPSLSSTAQLCRAIRCLLWRLHAGRMHDAIAARRLAPDTQRHTQHRNAPPCNAHTTRCKRRILSPAQLKP
jgi:hypothetical protein